MKYEDLQKLLLSHPNITFIQKYPNAKPSDFARFFEFSIGDTVYTIEWYRNICYLYVDSIDYGLKVPFDHVILTGTWPNSWKLNLQFYTPVAGGTNAVAILPLERYQEKS